MKVHILFSAVGDYLPKYQQPCMNLQQKLADEIIQKAKDVWNTRATGENTVRFLQKMPAKHGSHFRFFEVTQRDENTLLVSHGRM